MRIKQIGWRINEAAKIGKRFLQEFLNNPMRREKFFSSNIYQEVPPARFELTIPGLAACCSNFMGEG